MPDILDTINAHLIDYNNPHKVTKESLGLGNVDNFPIATKEEAFEGTAVDRFVTPVLVKEVFKGVLTRHRLMNSSGKPIPI